ncbi:hypothetical protein [Litoreibacter janthinus]|uniref:Uncharacterized protein n=1 Tax=Litoreibacter janthinus TaxID=670154 RepID=A0A1I6HQX6_9RHOB|nr:hypothetical protein [Litoreibacter janthinus]SFR56784.1 hypothetical protein SAMN04488002_3276 [Litoreibacter janthinus]
MSFVLSTQSVTDLRFDSIYKHMLAYLVDLDPARFRGLGDANCKAFVRQGLAFCDAHKIEFMEHIEYVHFMMYFIGTGFPRDPRYTALTGALTDQSHVAHQRIETAHRIFRKFADRFVGIGLAQTKSALTLFNEQLTSVPDDKLSPRAGLDAFYVAFDFTPQERDTFPEAHLVDAARQSANALDMETPTGYGLCLSLALWLGTGFAQDPLFPWVRDIPAQAPDTPQERARVLKDYAIKRMTKMLPNEET